MTDLDLTPNNTELLDDDFSNFRAFGIGRPSPKQIARVSQKNPKKLERWKEKGIIPSEEIGVEEEGYVEPETTNTRSNRSSSENKTKKGLSDNAKIAIGVGSVIATTGIFLLIRHFVIKKRKG